MSALQDINRQVNSRSVRERVLLFLTLLAVIYFAWDALIMQQLLGSQEKINQKANKLRNQIVQLESKISTISNTIKTDPALELKQKIADLQSQNKAIDDKISNLTSRLIPPNEMTSLLNSILATDEGLTVEKMENIPETPLFPPPKNEEEKAKMGNRQQVYKHGLHIEFTGTYFNTKKFLEALERLKWKLLWEELSYSVDAYPNAKVKLIVYTLSLETQWIGT